MQEKRLQNKMDFIKRLIATYSRISVFTDLFINMFINIPTIL